MSSWTIVALGPSDTLEGCAWRSAADAAAEIAAAHGHSFELLLVGSIEATGEGWNELSRAEWVRTAPLEAAAQIAGAVAPLLAARSRPLLIVVPPGPVGEEIAANLAVRLSAHSLGRARNIVMGEREIRATRTAFGGRAEIELSFTGDAFAVAARGAVPVGNRPSLPALTLVAGDAGPALETIRTPIAGREMPLEGAKIVVSGGRGLDEQGFALLGEIAEAVSGAVGGSLPAVDAGMVAVSRQVGQSGKFVTPSLYVAVGMSGTPQHLAGIGAATRIIALNKDSAAPIFAYAELGAVADAREVLPLLRDQLKEGG